MVHIRADPAEQEVRPISRRIIQSIFKIKLTVLFPDCDTVTDQTLIRQIQEQFHYVGSFPMEDVQNVKNWPNEQNLCKSTGKTIHF